MSKSFLFIYGSVLFLSVIQIHSFPAFPGAEGWGAETPGGRGGKVYIVTNLNSSGQGSFNDALYATEPRIIVFRVSGVINMNTTSQAFELNNGHSNLTIAGQTSPGGITLVTTNTVGFATYGANFHDFIIRFLRFRNTITNTTYDGVMLNSANHFIFDHCDFSGGTDEIVDGAGASTLTFQWCTITNHTNVGENQGILIAYDVFHVTLHHTFFAHFQERAPVMHWNGTTIQDYGAVDYRNNVIYNIEGCQCVQFGPHNDMVPSEVHVNVAGNYFKAGPNTLDMCMEDPGNMGNQRPVWMADIGKIYLNDNYWIQKDGSASNQVLFNDRGSPTVVTVPFDMPAVTTEPVQEAYESVLNKVGAWPRDSMNARTIREAKNGTGQFYKVDDPLIQDGHVPPQDMDNDGMTDCWEQANGLNPAVADDKGDFDGTGYTNIEKYINDIASIQLNESTVYPTGCVTDYYNPNYTAGIKRNPGANNNLALIKIRPNPFSGTTKIECANVECAPRQGSGQGMRNLRIDIFNVNGKMVYLSHVDGRGEKYFAPTATTWDARDLSGHPVPPGIYMVRLIGENKILATEKILLVK